MRILMDAAEQKDWQKGLMQIPQARSRKRAQTMFDEFTGAEYTAIRSVSQSWA